MKPQIKKTVALILITALSAGVLTLAACRNKTETEETTAAEDFLQAEDTDASDNAAQKEGLNLSEEDEALLALCEVAAAIPRNTGTQLSDEEIRRIMHMQKWGGYSFVAEKGEMIDNKIYLYGSFDAIPDSVFGEYPNIVMVLNLSEDGGYSFSSVLPDVDAVTLAIFRAVLSLPRGTGTPLTEEELADVMEALPCLYRGDPPVYEDYYNIPSCSAFLSSYYANVKDISLYGFLRELPWREAETQISEEEAAAYAGDGYKDGYYTPPRRITVSYLEDLFETYAGLSTEELRDYYKDLPRVTYLEEFDALYFVSDNPGVLDFQISSAERIGDKIYLYEDQIFSGGGEAHEILVLTEAPDGGWFFSAHLPAAITP